MAEPNGNSEAKQYKLKQKMVGSAGPDPCNPCGGGTYVPIKTKNLMVEKRDLLAQRHKRIQIKLLNL